MCGCGGSTQGRYCPGHDRRHTAELVKMVLVGDITEQSALAEIGPYPLAERFQHELANARQ